MNFLAHCALAHDAALSWDCDTHSRRGLLAGAVIGDFIKGPIPGDWPGTRLHRKVDALSNQLPAIRRHCDEFPSHMRRFAPIFVDLLADHCLAQHWQAYYVSPLSAFSSECYDAMAAYQSYLPKHAERFVAYMFEVDLLANYHQWPHIARGLKSVLKRLDREHLHPEVEQTAQRVAVGSHAHFGVYFPQLQTAWHSWDVFEVLDGS